MKLPKFPAHECSLTLQHNEHLNYYSTVADELEDPTSRLSRGVDWVSDEQREKAIATNNLWTLQWYPKTPIGFCSLAACDLEELLGQWNEFNGICDDSLDLGYQRRAAEEGHAIDLNDFERGRQAGIELASEMNPYDLAKAEQTISEANGIRIDIESQRDSVRRQFVAVAERERLAAKAVAEMQQDMAEQEARHLLTLKVLDAEIARLTALVPK